MAYSKSKEYTSDSLKKAEKLFKKEKSSYYVKSGTKAINIMWKLNDLFEGQRSYSFRFSTFKKGRYLSRVVAETAHFYGEWEASSNTLHINFNDVKQKHTEMKTKTEKALMAELHVGTKPETVKNPFSGASVELEPQAVALYDFIKGCEMMGKYSKMNKALHIFMKYWPEEYMVLLN